MKGKITTVDILTSAYNEEECLPELFKRIDAVFIKEKKYSYRILVIDNSSTDSTWSVIQNYAKINKKILGFRMSRNFTLDAAFTCGLDHAQSDLAIIMTSDLQDPPELIPKFIEAWENGYKVAFGVKPESKDYFLMHQLRKFYYKFIEKISDVPIIKNATGFGIYDREVLENVRKINDPYPFFRGIIADLGYEIKQIPFIQKRRARGISKNNFFTLYDIGMLGIVNHSIVPIRIASLIGFFVGSLSFLAALIFLILKLIYWNSFPLGISPIIIGMFLMFGLIFIFIGFLGEYIGSIHTYIQKRPVVVEKERINFD